MDITIAIDQNEKDFILACIRKERWAQQKLYEDNYSTLMVICLRYAKDKDEAMDILHEGFIKIFRNIHKYNPGTSLIAWMRRIMVNTSIDYYRKMVRRRTEDIGEAYDLYSEQPDAVSKMSSEEILKSIQVLTPAYRLVFNMYVIEGFSHREIADKLGITESTSRSNLVKARGKLRDMINQLRGHGE